MADPKPMPRPAIVLAGWIIALAAVAGFGLGVARDMKRTAGFDSDAGDVVAPIKTVANAQPLVAPPVTEADVRRWTREELSAQHPAAPKRPKADDAAASPDDSTDDTANMPPLPPSAGNITAPKPAVATPVKPAQQIPF